jgi:glycerol-3-phosphate dehydrogenase
VTEVADVAIVGAGVVGCAIARDLARHGMAVTVIDRAADVGEGTSKANTAILHTGFDTVPGSLESRLVSRGHHLMVAYAEEAGIAVEPTGALVVAWDDEQEAALPGLVHKARANGYDAAQRVDSAEVRRREPHLGPDARSGIEVPGESIIDPWSLTLALATEAIRAGAALRLNSSVEGVEEGTDEHVLVLSDGRLRARWVINAAGLFSDRVDRMLGHDGFTVTPRRGQLIVFDKLARGLVSRILLPVPTERSKGVLVSPTVWGNVLVGPTAEDLEDRGDTATTEAGIAQLLRAGRAILPPLLDEEVTATYAGLRAATADRDYQIRLHAPQRYVCAGGIRSTGLTASLAIAEHVADLLRSAGVVLDLRGDLDPPPSMPALGEAQRRPYQRADLIERDPEYGRLLCHCERATVGEVRDACRSEVPATDLAGVRRRTRAMNGRCQGFYCGAEVVALTAAETGRSAGELTGVDR